MIRTKNDDIEALEKEKIEMYTKINHYKNYEIKITENEQVVKRLNDQIAQLKADAENWQKKLRDSDARAKEFENQLFKNNQEKERLTNMIKTKSNEYEILRNRYSELEINSRKVQELELVCQEQHNQILSHISEIERFESKLKDYEAQLDKERDLVTELGFKVIVLSSEIERQAGGGATSGGLKSREYEELKENYSRLQSKVTSKNNEVDILLSKVGHLESKVSTLTQEFKRLLEIVQRSENESKELGLRIDEYQDYARRINILGAEIDRLQATNKALD